MGQRAVHGPLKAVPVRWQDCLATPLRCAENRENTKLRLAVSFSSHILASSLVQYASCNFFPYVKVWMGFSVHQSALSLHVWSQTIGSELTESGLASNDAVWPVLGLARWIA